VVELGNWMMKSSNNEAMAFIGEKFLSRFYNCGFEDKRREDEIWAYGLGGVVST
jgi:hypothetical protein